MEILIVVLLLVILAALAFAWMKFRPDSPGSAGGLSRRGGGLRGPRRTAVAARHDPMAEAVERHAQATDPHEAAEAELRLQAQANRVASELHAREAASLDAQTRGIRGHERGTSAHAYDQPAYEQPAYGDGRPIYEDEHGRSVYADGTPVHTDGRPVYEDGTPMHTDDRPVYEDEHGHTVYEDGTPVHRDDRPAY